MLLGDVIRRMEDEVFVTETVLRIADLGVLTRLRQRAADNDVSIGDYAVWAVRCYADNAPADEWTNLIGILGREEDPGAACLERALTYVLAAEGAPDAAAAPSVCG
jgi:hypothetical protein